MTGIYHSFGEAKLFALKRQACMHGCNISSTGCAVALKLNWLSNTLLRLNLFRHRFCYYVWNSTHTERRIATSLTTSVQPAGAWKICTLYLKGSVLMVRILEHITNLEELANKEFPIFNTWCHWWSWNHPGASHWNQQRFPLRCTRSTSTREVVVTICAPRVKAPVYILIIPQTSFSLS